MRRTAPRILVGVGVAAATIVALTAVASAVPVTPGTPRQGSLTKVGPLTGEEDKQFPVWYEDSTGLRLEACTTVGDQHCAVPADELAPTGFPGEFFYQLAGAELTLAGGVEASVGMDLEGAFADEEAQTGLMVFGRVRIRFAAPAGQKYRITHPYGIDEIVAEPKDGVRFTEDIGASPGAFGGALSSRIGPFLQWDPAVGPAAPAGYVGDPDVPHRVVGSPYGTNFVKIDRIDAAGTVLAELGRTDLFSVQGRKATNSGVTFDQATYTVGADGKGVVEVYATSDPGQAIEITGNAALGFRTTRLSGQNGRYYGRLPVTGSVPAGAAVEVVNASDRPATKKTRPLVDVVTVARAAYDANLHTLTVTAESSDRDATPGVLTVDGFGPLGATAFANVLAPPATVTVRSSKGGLTTVPVTATGAAMQPDAPVAAAATPASAVVGQTVTLDGSASLGAIDSYAWRQTAGPAGTLSGASAAKATFVASVAGTYTFQLVVTGPGGVSAPMAVTVNIKAGGPMVANAGPDQVVVRGSTVTLNASATEGANSYSWRQLPGSPAVTLTGAGTARPTFTLPLMALPTSAEGNPNYTVDNNSALAFELTATGPGGTHTDQVVVTPKPENLVGQLARYRAPEGWRIRGTSDVRAGQQVAIVLGSDLKGRVITTVTVAADGTIDARPAGPSATAGQTVYLVSSTGGRSRAVTVTNN